MCPLGSSSAFDNGFNDADVVLIKAWSEASGVMVEWPSEARRPDELALTVREFCHQVSDLSSGGVLELPARHPHHHELRPLATPDQQLFCCVELSIAEGFGFLGLTEPSAEERLHGARIEPGRSVVDDTEPGPLMIRSFRYGPNLEGFEAATGPDRPWSEFKAALLNEANQRGTG